MKKKPVLGTMDGQYVLNKLLDACWYTRLKCSSTDKKEFRKLVAQACVELAERKESEFIQEVFQLLKEKLE